MSREMRMAERRFSSGPEASSASVCEEAGSKPALRAGYVRALERRFLSGPEAGSASVRTRAGSKPALHWLASWKLALPGFALFAAFFLCVSLRAEQGRDESGLFTVDTRYGFSGGTGVSGFFKVDTRLSGSAGDAASGTFTVDTRGAVIGVTTFTGRVMDIAGLGLGGATVTALQSSVVRARVSTDAGGYYTLPPLPPGAYELAASAPATVQDRRVVRLSAATGRQDFLLRALPSKPVVMDTQETPVATLLPTRGPQGSQLKVFDGAKFVPDLALLDRSKLTVVLTHGWIICGDAGGIDHWPTEMAKAMRRAGLTAAQANIVGWDWHTAASPCLPPNPPEGKTPEQGVALGKALHEALGADYAQPVHFMGHSLGTLVNAYAATWLQGQPVFRVAGAANQWLASQMQMTLFDEAEIARIAGKEVIIAGGLSFIAGQPVLPAAVQVGLAGRKTALPPDFLWADNYLSVVAVYQARAVNLTLQRAVRLSDDSIVKAHSYPMEWYQDTIANRSLSTLGFANSFGTEALSGTAFPPSGAGFQPGVVWRQSASPADPHQVERVNGLAQLPYRFPLLGAVVSQGVALGEHAVEGAVDLGRKVGNVVVGVREQIGEATYQGLNYLGDKLEDAHNGVLDLLNRPGLNLHLGTGLPPLFGGNAVKQGTPAGPTNSPAYVWLPVSIPADAAALVFDYTLAGDPKEDEVTFGINGTNVFSVAGKFVPENEPSVSRLIDVTAYAGTTNEFFFGVTGGTSTNCTVTVENLRFFTLQPPQLAVDSAGGEIVLSWPSTANGYLVESAGSVTATDWTALPQPPALFAGRFSVTNAPSGEARFFRLRRE